MHFSNHSDSGVGIIAANPGVNIVDNLTLTLPHGATYLTYYQRRRWPMSYHIDDDIAETKPFQSLTISTDQTELCQILFPQMELFSMFHLLARILSHSSSFVAQHYLHYSEKKHFEK